MSLLSSLQLLWGGHTPGDVSSVYLHYCDRGFLHHEPSCRLRLQYQEKKHGHGACLSAGGDLWMCQLCPSLGDKLCPFPLSQKCSWSIIWSCFIPLNHEPQNIWIIGEGKALSILRTLQKKGSCLHPCLEEGGSLGSCQSVLL